jgi:hypothetical protein
LGLVKVTNALSATVMGDDINIVADSLSIANVITFGLSVTSGFKDRFIGTFWETCSTRDAFIRNQ